MTWTLVIMLVASLAWMISVLLSPSSLMPPRGMTWECFPVPVHT